MTSAFSSPLSASRTWPLRGLVLALSLWTGAAAASQTLRLPSVCVASVTPFLDNRPTGRLQRPGTSGRAAPRQLADRALDTATRHLGSRSSRKPTQTSGRSSRSSHLRSSSLQPHKARVALSGQNAVGQAFADHAGQHFVESVPVAQLSLVESERLPIAVAGQMEWCHGHVGAFERALQERPEILQSVRMDAASDVPVDVVNPFVEVPQTQRVITRKGIGEDMGTGLDILAHVMDQSVVVHIGNTPSANFPTALKQALNDGFAHSATASDLPFALASVHVPRLPADEGFIYFHFASQFSKCASFHRKPDAVEHEPRRFLSYLQRSGKLATADPVLRVSDAPNGDEPLVQPERAVLEDRADLHAKLLAAILGFALEHRPGPDDPDLVTATLRAGDSTVWPLRPEHGFKASFRIREVTYSTKQTLRCFIHSLDFSTLSR